MNWPPYLAGIATIPVVLAAVIVLSLIAGLLFGRTKNGMKCEVCDWGFAGMAANYDACGENQPRNINALAARAWHAFVLNRTPHHRRAWTTRFEQLPPTLQRHWLPNAHRFGVREHHHRVAGSRETSGSAVP